MTLDELIARVLEAVDEYVSGIDDDAVALGIEAQGAENDKAVTSAADEVESATNGAVSADDYAHHARAPSVSSAARSTFDRILEEGKRELLMEAASNINAFSRQALNQANLILDDFDALLEEIGSEAAKISVAAAAGLLVPPERQHVQELRDQTQVVADEAERSATDLRSARARRRAARLHLDGLTAEHDATQELDGIPQTGRNDPANVSLALATAAAGDPTLQAQAMVPGRAGTALGAQSALLQSSVLDRVSYIAICLAIGSLDTSSTTKDRAQRLFARLRALITALMASFEAGFVTQLQGQLQELAADAIDGLADVLQGKLEAFDLWLSTSLPALPTFVSTVNAIGDKASSLPILQSVAAQCGLKMDSFCDFQGLLEVAKSLDAELGLVQPRPPALGRVRLLVVAPEADDFRPTTEAPDQEARMLLVSPVAPGSTEVVARLPRAAIRSELSAPVPPLSGTVAAAAEAGADSLLISNLPTNIAGLGNITVNPGPLQTVLRYSSYVAEGADTRFSLIDKPETVIAGGAPVSVTGEHRDTFSDVFVQSQAIKGGPGKLVIGGDGEMRQELTYTSSSFNPSSGRYTFKLASSTALGVPEHRFLVLCRPHPSAKELLYKSSLLMAPAERFKIVGDEITHVTNPDFDFTSGGTLVITNAADYDDGTYRLLIGQFPHSVEIDAVNSVLTGTGTKIKLKSTFYGGDQDRVTLSRALTPVNSGATALRLRLDARQKADLGIETLDIGNTKVHVDGRVVIDGGGGTVRLSDVTSNLNTPSGVVPVQRLTSRAPLVRGDETGFSIEILSGKTVFTALIVDSNKTAQTLDFELPLRSGTVNVVGTSVTGTGTKFASEFQVGDFVFINDSGLAKISNITSDTSMTLATAPGNVTGKQIYISAPGTATAARPFTVLRRPQETMNFSSITNVDDTYYDLNLDSPTAYVHGLQEPEVTPTVHILPEDDFNAFLDRFIDPASNVTPRFDGTIVPPGTTVVRAEFEDPLARPLLGGFVEQATTFIARGREVAVTPTNVPDADGIYAFNLTTPLTFPLADGDVIEVETTSVFDQLKDLFQGSTDWARPFDDFFAELGLQLKRLDAKFCRLLGGRPQDLGLTAAAIVTAVATARAAIFPIRIVLKSLALGLPTSPVIARVMDTFLSSGMDAAAEAVASGDVLAVSQLKATNATKEGETRENLQALRDEVTEEQLPIIDRMVSHLAAREKDKEFLADARRPYPEIARDRMQQKKEAAQNLAADTEVVTA